MQVLRFSLLLAAACGLLAPALAEETTLTTQIEQLKKTLATLELLKAAQDAETTTPTLELTSFAATDSGSTSGSSDASVGQDDSSNSEYAIEPLPTRAPSASSSSVASEADETSESSSSGSSTEEVATPTPTPTDNGAASIAATTGAVLTTAVVYALL